MRYAVVGGSAAAVSAVEAIRSVDRLVADRCVQR